MFGHKPNQNQKIVMAFGTFDYIHAGHENYLKKAKELGDYLIVIIARDETVKSVKGEFPHHSEKKRVNNLKNTGIPDKVMLGNAGDKHKVITKFKPKIIALGYDQYVFTQKLEKTLIDHGLDTEIIRLEPYFPQIYKTSLIKKSLLEKQAKNDPNSIETTKPSA